MLSPRNPAGVRAPLFLLFAAGCFCLGILLAPASAQTPADAAAPAQGSPAGTKSEPPVAQKPVPLNKSETVLFDAKGKRLLVKGKVCLREGLLEMLVCKKQTKEHESIIAIDADAYVIHAGLLALGAKTGAPVRFTPKFQPPSGTRIDIFIHYEDKDGKPHRVPAQQWVRHATRRFFVETLEALPPGVTIPRDSELRFDAKHKELSWYGRMTADERDALLKLSDNKEFQALIRKLFDQSQIRDMKAHWVFAGSGFYVDEATGDRFYEAEGGDVICVANFPSAMIDVAAESSATGEANLLFEAHTERIPPVGTEVTVELVPVLKPEKSE